ncbi:MAG: hypothetical protein LUH12_02875 [Bacteroides sp.]|nr:hypothetical protein [Bacteroides sp.]
MHFLSNQEDADDALQEAFFRLWKHADQIDTPEKAEAMTVITVKNLCIDTLRKKKSPAYSRAGRKSRRLHNRVGCRCIIEKRALQGSRTYH